MSTKIHPTKSKPLLIIFSFLAITLPMAAIYFQLNYIINISSALILCSLLSTRVFLNSVTNHNFLKIILTLVMIFILIKLIYPKHPEDEKIFFTSVIGIIYGLDIRQYTQDFFEHRN